MSPSNLLRYAKASLMF